MKKLVFIFSIFCSVAFVSCNEHSTQDKQQIEGEVSTIRVVSPKEVYDAIKEDTLMQLIDVRTAEEFGVTHLKTSQNICVTTPGFKERAAKLDKSLPVYVYCKKGGRSAKASKILAEMGFTQIFDLQGGITNWESQDLEMIKG
ncbi:thioredoxin [unidentified eubacterium SCB49]|nr:thioredoxin [unidentified eubacterium SCB49]